MAQLEIVGQKYKSKYIVTFDDIDIRLVLAFKWHVRKGGNVNYAWTRNGLKHMSMHELIMPNNNELLVHDHIDHNGLNNCRSNLRLVTNAENTRSKRHVSSNTGHKGVSYIESLNKYQATIVVKGKSITVGKFKDLEDAVKAYKFAAKIYLGVD
jgi:hypothetical protein